MVNAHALGGSIPGRCDLNASSLGSSRSADFWLSESLALSPEGGGDLASDS